MCLRARLAALGILTLAAGAPLTAQAHDHAAAAAAPARDARLDLVLGGPHLILHHRGYLALSDSQVVRLTRVRHVVCDAEATYGARSAEWRDRLPALLSDTARATTPRLQDVMQGLAVAESDWLTVLVRARRDAIAVLTLPQRAQHAALLDHWTRESIAMIEEATRPGQRGHPGMQIPIRVPGMVVGTTTLLPYCEALHGPSMHLSVPPP